VNLQKRVGKRLGKNHFPGGIDIFTVSALREHNVTPWDTFGAVQPPLRALLLSDEQEWPRQGRALVPGCGRVQIIIDSAFLLS